MDTQHLINSYTDWLNKEITYRLLDTGYTEITIPFLNCASDYIQFYVKEEGDQIIITDSGEVIGGSYLAIKDLPLTSTRKSIIKTLLAQYGVDLEETKLIVKTTTDKYPAKQHDFIQAMICIDNFLNCL